MSGIIFRLETLAKLGCRRFEGKVSSIKFSGHLVGWFFGCHVALPQLQPARHYDVPEILSSAKHQTCPTVVDD